MRNLAKTISFLFCAVFFIGNIFPQSTEGWLYTQGNKIYKSDSTVFTGRGANIFDTRLNNAGTYEQPNVAEVNRRTDELVDVWGADFLRLCLESNADLGEWQIHGLSILEDTAYLNDIVEIVEHIGTKDGVYVLVSVWIDPSLDDMGWPTVQTIEVWRILTQRLAQFPYVLFGICNEPQSNDDGALDSQVWTRMNNVVTAIREEEDDLTSPHHIITAQGTGGWARYLQYYVTHPITAGGGVNIAYEVHVYDHENQFQSRFIEPSQSIPVVIGEFGPAEGYMSPEECQTLMDEAEQLQVPYLAWSFHQRAPPSLLVDQTGSGPGIGMDLVPNEWGELLKNQLMSSGGPWIRGYKANPASVSADTITEVIFSAVVDGNGETVDSVIIDLTQIGGTKTLMNLVSGDTLYTYSYNVPSGLSTGTISIPVRAVNDGGLDRIVNIKLKVVNNITDVMVIYRDIEDHIMATWNQNGTLTEITGGAYEGSEHYRFTYSYSNWWSGFGLNLNNWSGDGTGYDFTGYEYLKLACSLTGPSTVTITLIDANASSVSTAVNIEGVNSGYQEITIPLALFTGLVTNDIGEILIEIHGNSISGSGTFFIDDIVLCNDPAVVGNKQVHESSRFCHTQNYPNPFSSSTTIIYEVPENGHYSLRVFDITGRQIMTLVDESKAAGTYKVEWNGTNSAGQKVGRGMYFYRITNSTKGTIASNKMIISN